MKRFREKIKMFRKEVNKVRYKGLGEGKGIKGINGEIRQEERAVGAR